MDVKLAARYVREGYTIQKNEVRPLFVRRRTIVTYSVFWRGIFETTCSTKRECLDHIKFRLGETGGKED